MTPNRLPLVMFLFVGLVAAAAIGTLTASWVWFGVAVGAHMVGSFLTISGWMKAARAGDRSTRESDKLEAWADDAVDGGPRTVENELEALKREPAQRI